MNVSRTNAVAGAIAVAALALISACGSSSSGGSTSASSSQQSTAGDASVIRVGNIGSYTGTSGSSTSQLPDVIKAWASWTNAHGGIDGHQVRLYVEDDQFNATQAEVDVRTLINTDKVVAIISDMSVIDADWASYAQQAGVPVVGGEGVETPFVTNPDFFPSAAGTAVISYEQAVQAKRFGTKAATIYCTESPACAGVAAANKQFAGDIGVSVPYATLVPATTPDYTPQCEAVKSSGAQSMLVGIPAAPLVSLVGTCNQQGVDAYPILSGGAAASSVITSSVTKNLLVVDSQFPYFDMSTPATAAFHSAMKEYAPNVELGSEAAEVWTGGVLFTAGVEAAHAAQVTSASVKDGLYALPKGTTLGGLTPPLSFIKGAPKPTVVNCVYVWGKKNGTLFEPFGLVPQCVPSNLLNAYDSKNL